MRALVAGVGGTTAVVVLARAARRFSVADRLHPRTPARYRVPAGLRRRVVGALDAAALDVDAEHACATWALAIVVAAIVGLGLAGAQVGVGLGVFTALGVPAAVLSLRHRRQQQIAAAVPETLECIASELRAGGTIATALASVAGGDTVLASDLARIDTRTRLGAGFADAMRAWSCERAAPGVAAAAGALAMCSSVGGRAADALDGLASSLRDRLAVAAEARALSAQARMSAVVVGGTPLGYLAWSALVDPHALHALVGTGLGHVCLVVGLGLEALGAWWMRRIVRAGSAL